MSRLKKQEAHRGENDHEEGAGCGHMQSRQKGHSDCAHDGSTHHKNKLRDIPISAKNPGHCRGDFNESSLKPADLKNYEKVSHGGHKGYLVPDGKGSYDLYCPHNGHCDHHGKVKGHKPAP